MDLDIVDGKIGEVGAYDVELKGGKLSAKVGVGDASGAVSGQMIVSIDAKIILDKIKEAIPGQIDDVLINVLESALLS